MTEIEEDRRNENIFMDWKKSILVKWLYYPKLNTTYFIKLDKIFLKCVWNLNRPSTAKEILNGNKAGDIALYHFKICNKAIVIKIT